MKKKMKLLSALLVLLVYGQLIAQVGVGTTAPRGALDINEPITNKYGLVLPTTDDPVTKITTPQDGGKAVPGTIVYDSKQDCLRYFSSKIDNWSDCISVGNTQQGAEVSVDCSGGLSGSFTTGALGTDAKYTITVTNKTTSTLGSITFGSADLAFSIDNQTLPITISKIEPSSVSLAAGESKTITYYLSGSLTKEGTLTAKWPKLGAQCETSTLVSSRPSLPSNKVRIGNVGYYTFLGTDKPLYKQLVNPANYGPNGTYKVDIEGFEITESLADLESLTAEQLIEKYDIFCIGPYINTITTANLNKLIEFAKKKFLFVLLDNYINSNKVRIVATRIGGYLGDSSKILSEVNGPGSMLTVTANVPSDITRNVFGEVPYNTKITGITGYLILEAIYLPENAIVLATRGGGSASYLGAYLTGEDHRIFVAFDEGIIRSSDMSRDGTIDPNNLTDVYINNIMAHALAKVGYK